jgi:hypothetical protein
VSVPDPRVRDMLGPVGTAALEQAREAIGETFTDIDALLLTWAGWTPEAWTFTFLQREPARRLSLHVPHDGSPVAIQTLSPSDRPGSGPLAT